MALNNTFKGFKLKIISLVLLPPLLLVACGGSQEVTSSANQLNSFEVANEVGANELSSLNESSFLAPEKVISKLNYPVNDFTNTLSASERKNLDSKIQKIDEEGILQIGVVVVPTTGSIPILDYAMRVAEDWKLGSPENNNGLFILVVVEDRQMYILTGLDIEDKLTDERVSMVINEHITPEFQQNKYAQGLSFGIDALVNDMRLQS